MTISPKITQSPGESVNSTETHVKRCLKINEITYQNNIESDYTEKIEALDRDFNYTHNCQHPWGPPELSIFYGTSLYEAASPSQKLFLNHLFWATQYEHVASSESSTIMYNQVTAGVFDVVGGYSTLCKSLDLETHQERYHVHAFNNIAYKTKQEILGNTLKQKGTTYFKESSKDFFNFDWAGHLFSDTKKYEAFRYITNKVIKNQEKTYSPVLKKLEERNHIPALQTGYIGEALPRPALQFITYNWGSSPFLACQHYVWRYMGNASLKVWEYYYVKYYRELEKQGAFIPAPTAVSYFHLMDESFHTTTSQLIARDIYQDFPEPTAYETVAANLIHYFMQRGILSNLSGGIPSLYRSDSHLYPFYYRILRSPIFGMSAEEALGWMEKSFCQEHEGFHCNMKMHKSLLSDLQRVCSTLEYLWPINREYRLMASGGSINKAIANNIQTFRNFRQSVAEIN